MTSVAAVFRKFAFGARLTSHDVRRLAAARGLVLSNNHVREVFRSSDRGGMLTLDQLYAIVAAWADEQRGVRREDRRP